MQQCVLVDTQLEATWQKKNSGPGGRQFEHEIVLCSCRKVKKKEEENVAASVNSFNQSIANRLGEVILPLYSALLRTYPE